MALNQGVLPKYTAGLYEKQNTSMVVSRGLGNRYHSAKNF
ncbi:Phosphoesterase [Bacillus cereus ATCC 4342]|nr:Phosphoesterase [Bacillus cereus ATCC 4342]